MKNLLVTIGILLFVCCVYYIHKLIKENNKLKEESIINTQNIKAYEDTLRTYVLTNSDLLYAKESFLKNEKEMKEKLEENDIKYKELVKKLSKPTTITKVETQYLRDTILIERNDSTKFSYKDDWLGLEGEVSDSLLNIYNIDIPVPLVVGQTDDLQVFVTSKNPYIKITDLENNIVYKKSKKKHWGVGINVGPGVYYGFTSKKIDIGIGVGIGLHYDF